MWFTYSLIFAFWTSLSMLIIKKILRDISPVLFLIITLLFTMPFLIGLLLFLGVPSFSFNFFKFLFFASILDTLAAILYYKALSISEISLLAPISSLNPIFVLVFAFFLLHETPTPLKFLGISIIVLGTYLLNIAHIRSGILKPFTKLFSDKGVRLFLVTNFIWGITPIFQKRAIFETNPTSLISVPLIESVFIVILLSPFLLKVKQYKSFTVKNFKMLLLFGALSSLGAFAAMSAFTLSNLAYVTAIFKLSTLFSVILGTLFFNERNIRERFLGASVMVLGTIFLAI